MFVYILYPVGAECLKKICIKFNKQRLINPTSDWNHRKDKYDLLTRIWIIEIALQEIK